MYQSLVSIGKTVKSIQRKSCWRTMMIRCILTKLLWCKAYEECLCQHFLGLLRCNNSSSDSDEKLLHSICLKLAPRPSYSNHAAFSVRSTTTKQKKQNRWTLNSVLNNNYLFLSDEKWKVLIKLPSVFSIKRCPKAHSHDRRLKKNKQKTTQ